MSLSHHHVENKSEKEVKEKKWVWARGQRMCVNCGQYIFSIAHQLVKNTVKYTVQNAHATS